MSEAIESGRRELDAYNTDERLAHCIVRRLHEFIGFPQSILEPSSGDAAFVRSVRKWFGAARVHAMDINPVHNTPALRAGAKFVHGDFLVCLPDATYDLVVGNPPYSSAEAFVARSLLVTNTGGHVCFLLRTDFLNGQARNRKDGVFDDAGLRMVIPLAERPSFTGDGKTDHYNYSVFVWRKGYRGCPSISPALWWRS